MKITTKELSEKLQKEFAGKTFIKPDCYNKRPAIGYAIVGHSGITNAIKLSGLPIYNYWSGSAPTPSSQAPIGIVVYARKIAL
jgi:hypothetical protein